MFRLCDRQRPITGLRYCDIFFKKGVRAANIDIFELLFKNGCLIDKFELMLLSFYRRSKPKGSFPDNQQGGVPIWEIVIKNGGLLEFKLNIDVIDLHRLNPLHSVGGD